MSNYDFSRLVTADGEPYTVIATNIPGDYPVLIEVSLPSGVTERALLDSNLHCFANPGYSLLEPAREKIRYLNFYESADGGVVPGRRTYKSLLELNALRDTARAVFSAKLVYSPHTGDICLAKV